MLNVMIPTAMKSCSVHEDIATYSLLRIQGLRSTC